MDCQSTCVAILVAILTHLLVVSDSTQAYPTGPDVEVVLDAMRTEIERSSKGLSLEEYSPPYFIAYHVRDSDTSEVTARGGAVYESGERRGRKVRVEVRVGSYTLDSTDDEQGHGYGDYYQYYPGQELPIDNDIQALRTSLWLLTDQMYKAGLTAFLRVKGRRVFRSEKKDRDESFTREEVVREREKVKSFEFDRRRWEKMARILSRRVSKAPEILDAMVRIEGRREVHYHVTTEGSELVTSHQLYAIHITAYTLADDGMLLDHSVSIYTPTEKALPGKKEMLEKTDGLVDDLMALRKAPTLDPFTGPVILESRAAGVFFHEAIGHRLEGHRQGDEEEGRTFAGQLGKQVLPEFLSIVDDPTLATFNDQPLNGFYRYDDEGIPSQRVELIKKGKLVGYLMGRKPAEGVIKSNGHGRAQGTNTPVARMGNLFVSSDHVISHQRLKELLLEEVRKAGKPFGLIVGDITGGSTNTMTYGYQAFKGGAKMVYRVDAKTGEETLVRGVEIVGTPLSSINKIVAAGDESGIFNGYCGAESGYVPVSTIAPALLFRELEMQRSTRVSQRPPILDRPKAENRDD